MRRIDAILIAFGVFLGGGIIYLILNSIGLDAQDAGIWSQVFLIVFVLVGWVTTYLIRVFTNNMTYHKQVKDYNDTFFQKRLEKMSPEEIEQLMKDN